MVIVSTVTLTDTNKLVEVFFTPVRKPLFKQCLLQALVLLIELGSFDPSTGLQVFLLIALKGNPSILLLLQFIQLRVVKKLMIIAPIGLSFPAF